VGITRWPSGSGGHDGGVTRRERPVLVYDGDCGFCTTSVRFVERRVRPDAEIVAFQFADLDALGTTARRAEYEVLWVGRGGQITGGAQAVAALLRHAGGPWWPLGALIRLAPFRWVAHGVYRLVANNRDRMPGGTAACALPAARRPGDQGAP
jgi:predicted DCC family thiol-disulfide oxidoreductase YuxK